MKSIKVSVIIPIYNVELYLNQCLDSVINQNIEDIEIIAINDGSTDRSSQILLEYKEKYDNIIVINQENKGQGAARNLGIEKSSGKYIYFLDSDDFIDSNLLSEFYDIAEKYNTDILTFDSNVFFENDKLEEVFNLNYDRKTELKSELMSGESYYFYTNINDAYKCSPCIQFFNRKFLIDNKIYFYEGIIHEDEIFTAKATILAKRILYVPKKYFNRRVRNGSTITNKKTYKNVIGYLTVAEELYKLYIDNLNKVGNNTSEVMLKSVINFYDKAYNITFDLENQRKEMQKKIRKSILKKKQIYNLKNLRFIIKIKIPILYSLYKKIILK